MFRTLAEIRSPKAGRIGPSLMVTRREALRLLTSLSVGTWIATQEIPGLAFAIRPFFPENPNRAAPALAPGAPNSPERIALIDQFREKSAGVEKAFEPRELKRDWTMPYRLFRPAAKTKAPLVLYLHGSGGLGDDNQKQMGLGNVFGTRVWALEENQKRFPCYVVVPQTDRGWVRYDEAEMAKGVAKMLPGLGEGARMALEVVDAVAREFAVDRQRIYVTGQSMGGGGTWNVLAARPRFFAAAMPLCASITLDDGSASPDIPLWAFHGDSDQTVPVATSRDRMAARRKAGGNPLYTEYPGVDHNVWEWAYTEPALIDWVYAQRLQA